LYEPIISVQGGSWCITTDIIMLSIPCGKVKGTKHFSHETEDYAQSTGFE